MTKPKKVSELTSKGLAKRLFPKEVREEAKKEAAESDKKGEKKKGA